MIFLEDGPLINYLRGKPLVSDTMISLASLIPHFFHIPVLDPLNVEIKCFPAQPETKSAHYFISTPLFNLHVSGVVSPSSHCKRDKSLLKLLDALGEMLIPLLLSLINLLSDRVSLCDHIILEIQIVPLNRSNIGLPLIISVLAVDQLPSGEGDSDPRHIEFDDSIL